MAICPCCGHQTAPANWRDGGAACAACGALPVGPPLASPVQRLPSYGVAASAGAGGALLALALGAGTLAALAGQKPFLSAGFGDFLAAAQTAVWRLKFFLPALSVVAIWVSWRAVAKIRRSPERYVGRRAANFGLIASSIVFALTVSLIGVSVPERLNRRRLAIQARNEIPLHTLNRALIEYQILYGTYPAAKDDLRKLPDADGSIAAALGQMPSEGYSVSAEKASLPPAQTRKLRGVRLQPIALRDNADDLDGERISFTNYTLRLPGEDGVLGTDDDLVMRDGVILDRAQTILSDDAASIPAPPSTTAPAGSKTRAEAATPR